MDAACKCRKLSIFPTRQNTLWSLMGWMRASPKPSTPPPPPQLLSAHVLCCWIYCNARAAIIKVGSGLCPTIDPSGVARLPFSDLPPWPRNFFRLSDLLPSNSPSPPHFCWRATFVCGENLACLRSPCPYPHGCTIVAGYALHSLARPSFHLVAFESPSFRCLHPHSHLHQDALLPQVPPPVSHPPPGPDNVVGFVVPGSPTPPFIQKGMLSDLCPPPRPLTPPGSVLPTRLLRS